MNIAEKTRRGRRRTVSGETPAGDKQPEQKPRRRAGRDVKGERDLVDALRSSEARFRLLSRTASRLLAEGDPQALVEELCREVMAQLDCQVFFNFIIDEAAGRLRLNSCDGIPAAEAAKIEWLEMGEAVCGCVAQQGVPIVAADVQRAADSRTNFVRSYGVRAYASHPLFAHGKVIGTLSFGARNRDRFTDDELEVMKTLTDQVAVAMDRKRAEGALRESETRFRAIASSTPDHVLVQDRDLRYVMVLNPQIGLTEREMIGKTDLEVLGTEDAEKLTAIKRQIVKTGESVHVETSLTNRNGQAEFFEGSYVPRFDSAGQIDGLIGYFKNITDKKTAETELREEQERTTAILRGIADTFFSLDGEWRFTIVNPAAEGAPFGRPAAELLGEVIWDLYPDLVGTPIHARYLNAAATLCLEHYEAQSPLNGRWYEVFMQGWTRGVDVYMRDITERKRAEEALRESETRFRALAEMLPVAVGVSSTDGRVRYVNRTYETLFGYEPAELVGRPAPDLYVDPADRDAWTKLLHEHGVIRDIEERLKRKNGSWFWALMSVTRIQFGGEDAYLGSVLDITDRKQAEEALRRNEATLRSILDATKESIWLMSPEGAILAGNEIGLARTGRPAEEIVGKAFHEILPPELARTRLAHLKEVLATGRPVEFEDERAGMTFEHSFYAVPDQTGRAAAVVSFSRDVTEQKRTETELRQARDTLEQRVRERTQELTATTARVGAERQRFYDVLETLPAYVCLLTPDYYMPFANRTFRTLFGESGGKRCFEFLFGRTEPCETCETYAVLKTGREQRWEWVGPNGRTYSVFDYPFRDTDGSTLIMEMGIDITERRLAESALRERTAESEQSAAKLRALASELMRAEERERRRLAELLHDELQQLLAAARLRASMIANPTERHEIVDLLAQSIQTSRTITAELSPPILYDGDLPTALEGLARKKRAKFGADIALHIAPDADPGHLDGRLLLFRGARELLMNAHKHAPAAAVMLELWREDGEVALRVADDGPGFDVAATASGAGGGFGLFSLRERAEPLGGRLEVDSAPGCGARVTLRVPVAKPAAVGTTAPVETEAAAPAAASGGKIRVLLVDDHKIVRQGLAGMLAADGEIDVAGEAGDGLEAIEMARKLQPDVIVMDINMPRMNGLDATRMVVAEMPHVKVIGLSVHQKGDMETRMREAGAFAYLDKGGDGEQLLAAIRACRPNSDPAAPPAPSSSNN